MDNATTEQQISDSVAQDSVKAAMFVSENWTMLIQYTRNARKL